MPRYISEIILISLFLMGVFPGYAATEDYTVRDHAGRDVAVPRHPARVIALAPSVTEIVFALGRGNCLVGATEFSDYPEAARRIPRVGAYINLDLEKIVSLKPDLCIAVKDGNPLAMVRRLEEFGIPVFAVNPRDIESVHASILDIGKMLGAGKMADAMVTEMKAREDRVSERVSKSVPRPRVFFQIGVSPIVSAGSDTFIHELISRAGGLNVAGNLTGYPRFSKEEVLALSPDIIIVTSMEKGGGVDQVIGEWGQWPDMPAVRRNRVYLVDSDLFDRPSPRLVDAMEQLVRLIHPELH